MLRVISLPLAVFTLLAADGNAQVTSPGESPADSITRALDVLRTELGLTDLPAAGSFTRGDVSIAAGTRVDSAIGIHDGTLTVRGNVGHTVVVMNGDLVLDNGGVIEGDAVVVRGRIVMQGGVLRGAGITLGGDLRAPDTPAPVRTGLERVWHEVGVTLATLAIMIVLGIGVLLFAGGYLNGAADALALHPGKSFLIGILSQLATLPLLVLMIVALALTIIGLLLIPFAIVAFFLAVLGVCALGFLASAQVAGTAFGSRTAQDMPRRRMLLRALLMGVMLMGSVWLLAALTSATPIVGAALRGFAIVMTWVAVTAGVGAALLSRFSRRDAQPSSAAPEPEDISWQTPTPVTGVAAARRPVTTGAGGGEQ
jgi:hypothetical protein